MRVPVYLPLVSSSAWNLKPFQKLSFLNWEDMVFLKREMENHKETPTRTRFYGLLGDVDDSNTSLWLRPPSCDCLSSKQLHDPLLLA